MSGAKMSGAKISQHGWDLAEHLPVLEDESNTRSNTPRATYPAALFFFDLAPPQVHYIGRPLFFFPQLFRLKVSFLGSPRVTE